MTGRHPRGPGRHRGPWREGATQGARRRQSGALRCHHAAQACGAGWRRRRRLPGAGQIPLMDAVALLRDLGVEPATPPASHKLPPLHRFAALSPPYEPPATYAPADAGSSPVMPAAVARDLIEAVTELKGHALALTLAGRYLALHKQGGIRAFRELPDPPELAAGKRARGLSHHARHRGRAREPHRWAGRHREARGRGGGAAASSSVFPGAVRPAGRARAAAGGVRRGHRGARRPPPAISMWRNSIPFP